MLEKIFVGILLAIFGGIVLHAPLMVGFGTLWPDMALLIKSWKEILLGVALLLALVIVTQQGRWREFLRDKLLLLIAAFAAVNVLLIPLYFTGFEATVAGLFINLRFLLFFVLVYVALRLYPNWYRTFIIVFAAGVAVVLGFAVLQSTILPHDVLKYIGYGPSTIMPYLTVDQNYDFVRINSTLRGPNPLGAYAVIALAVALAYWFANTRKLTRQHQWILGAIGVAGAIALWASYSRSAAVAAIVAVGIVGIVVFGKRISKALWISMAIVALLVSGSFVALRDTYFVSNIILHEDPNESGAVNSNDGHVESLLDGTDRMLRQPLGAGIGSTGSASLMADETVIIENQYLFIAHENGWLGLALFIAINWLVLQRLWLRRRHWLGLGVFASGIGLVLIGLLLPVWVDDTVSIIWWGLAAIVLAVVPAGVKGLQGAQSVAVERRSNSSAAPRKAKK